MRYIGNKTRLLDFIGEVLDEHGIVSGRAIDAFAGTASVGRFLKRRGFSVTGCDLMTYSFVLQKVYVELDELPSFRKLAQQLGFAASVRSSRTRLARILAYLESEIGPRRSVISREFSSVSRSSNGARMYFTISNGSRIDAIRELIDEWRASDTIDEAERFVLLAALLESMDAVANTTGVYAAYVKSWQTNAKRPLRLKPPAMETGTGLECVAMQGDINQLARGIGRVNLVYLDPPYNSRQYAGYYHIPELVARGWSDGAPTLRGKTGLIPDADKRSSWSSRSGCVKALNDLLDNVDARYVLMSYNSEGIIPESAIRDAFESRGVSGSYRVHERPYARYRADRERRGRSYKATSVSEKMYFVELAR